MTDELGARLEAVLMVVDEPVPEQRLAEVVGCPAEEIRARLQSLAEEYSEQGRGFELARRGGGWRYYTRAEHAELVEQLVLDGHQARLSQAALETLAIVAYRQPVSRARIAAVRGVSSDAVVRTLTSRGLVVEVGLEPETGATLFGTTDLFLEKLGLDGLDRLPDLAPLLPEVDAVLDEEVRG